MKRLLYLLVYLLVPTASWAFPDNAVLEPFTGANNTTPPSANMSNFWVGVAGNGLRIISNAGETTVANQAGTAYWNVGTFGPNSEAYASIVTAGGTYYVGARLTTPADGTTDGYYVRLTAPSTVAILRLDNDAGTVLGSNITNTISAGDSFGIRVSGDNICAWYKNGASAWHVIGCRTDSAYTGAGYIGVGVLNSTNTTAMIDGFGGGNITTCTGASPTWVPNSLSQIDVQDCIDVAIAGDTINLPAGTATWSTLEAATPSVRLNKGVTLHGETSCTGVPVTCVAGTTIDDDTTAASGADRILMTGANSRITGISFVDSRALDDSKYTVNIQCANCRFDHNSVTEQNPGNGGSGNIHGIYTYSHIDSSTLIDHNYFRNMNGAADVDGSNGALDSGYNGNYSWSNPMTPGDANAVYIEDNNFDNSVPLDGAYDAYAGARLVFRFNTVVTTQVGGHGLDSGTNFRSVLRQEVYRNKFNNPNSANVIAFATRGGFHLVWDNIVTGNYTNFAWVRNYRSDDTSCGVCGNWGLCDGTKTWDQNTGGAEGYACLDQVGRGPATTTGTTFLTTFTEPLYPSYGWGNLKDGVPPTPGQAATDAWQIHASQTTCCSSRAIASHLLRNRDFYQEAASFNGSSGTGEGTLAARPTACTAGVAYFASNQGSWNTSTLDATFNPSGVAGEDGILYHCTVTGNPGTWDTVGTGAYTPYTYPHPLQAFEEGGDLPTAPTNLRIITESSGNRACLVWSASSLTNLAGYRIYHGTASGSYDPAVSIAINSVNTRHTPDTQYCYTSHVGGTHYFSVTAYDTQTLETELATEVSATFTALARATAAARGAR